MLRKKPTILEPIDLYHYIENLSLKSKILQSFECNRSKSEFDSLSYYEFEIHMLVAYKSLAGSRAKHRKMRW